MDQMTNRKFVSEVEKHPYLYDYTHKYYHKKEITEKAWSEVGKTVNLTALQAKGKWKNLRTVLSRNLKAARNGHPSKNRYYLTRAMRFAIPFIKISGNVQENLDFDKSEEIEVECTFQEDNNESQESNLDEEPPSPTTTDEHSYSLLPDTSFMETNINTYQEDEPKDMFEDDDINYANKRFLLSLLPDLNVMSEEQLRTFKRQVVCAIDSIRFGPPEPKKLVKIKKEPISSPVENNGQQDETHIHITLVGQPNVGSET